MAKTLTSHLNKLFLSLLLLLLHVGCFIFSSSYYKKNNYDLNLPTKKRKSSNNLSPKKAFSSSWCFIKRVFSPSNKRTNSQTRPPTPTNTSTTTSFSSPRSSQHSIVVSIRDSELHTPPRKRRAGSRSEFDSSLNENPFFPLRNDIFPCPTCGEVFLKQSLLETHQTIKHAVSELRDGDSGKNIVWIIFNTGWNNIKVDKPINIYRILKIHHSQKMLAKFEEFREGVKSKAARAVSRAVDTAAIRRDERCIADGNELLRFHCTTFLCNLGQNGNSALCNQVYCSACGIIRAGFSAKLDGISTFATSSRAHDAIPDDVEAEFAFMNVKRAMLVCRVIAGRVGCDVMVVDKEDPGFDSLVGRNVAGPGRMDDEELLVFNPRAVLPCFVIVYSV
ncbi:uncharacterized protein LOC130813874 [Amaranthus tricolor]|uniref:uncharacterized protein LOC130813874 n=1 Tax=Amaranthus tricolor TaxID=29722 RepID=UPI002587F0DE|nr:uncharacterized protein LOC130813874 [Amaranthus tricolor]